MTSSYQDSSFVSSARPVDTFVRQSTVPLNEDDGFSQLAKALSAVNPILDMYTEKAIEKEKEKGLKLAVDRVLLSGEVNKEATNIRKQDGDEAAKQFVGGSIFADRAYTKSLSKLYGARMSSDMELAYENAEIDSVDQNGQPIKKLLEEFNPSSEEFINWRESWLADFTNKIINEGGEVDSAEFQTNLTNTILNINKTAKEKNSDYKVRRIKKLSTDYLDKVTIDWLAGRKDEAKLHITEFINDTRLLGLTGADAKEVYTGLVENIAAVGEYYLTTGDVSDLDEIDDVILGFGASIPYGNNNGNLTQHPLWREKIAPVLEKLEDEKYEELIQGPKIDKAKRTIKLEKQLDIVNKLPIDNEEQRLLYKEEITKLKNNREFSDLNEIFKSNNYGYIEDFTAEILNIRTNMKLRQYRDNESPLENLALIKNKIVDLGITDNGILKDLNQAVNIASEYKSIYQIFDTKSKLLFDDIDAFYRSKAKSSNVFSTSASLGGGLKVSLGGLDNDSYIEKYNLEQKIGDDFEDWINENYYQKIDGIEKGGPSSSEIKKWIDDKRKEVETNNFKLQEKSEESKSDSVNQKKELNIEEAPAFTNKKFEVEPGTFSEGGFTTFEIESGDTLSAISNDFGIPMEAIMKANGITNANQIDIGNVLLIPEGVDYTDLNNINFIENLDKTKLITEKEHPYAPARQKHNFQVIYNIAKEIGIKYPELVAAQAMEETGYGETQSAENNFLGLKATTSEVAKGESERKLTTEFRGQGEQVEEANFKTFDNIRAMMMQYKKQWNDDFGQYKGLVNANSIQEAIKMLQAEDYATNPNYDKNVLDIIDRAINEGWF